MGIDLILAKQYANAQLASKMDAINANHFFDDDTARDAYFVLNPDELIRGVLVSSGDAYQMYNGAAWVTKTPISGVSKADYQVVKDFAEEFYYDNYAPKAVTDWTPTYCTVAEAAGVTTITGSGTNSAMNIRYVSKIPLTSGKKIYYRVKATAKNADVQTMRIRMLGSATAGTTVDVDLQTLPAQDTEYDFSGVFTQTNQTGYAKIDVYCNYTSAANADGKTIEITDMILVDLTDVFGAGNELTATQMDALKDNVLGDWNAGNISLSNLRQITAINATLDDKYTVDFETVELPTAINVYNSKRLYLIATKKDNYYNVDNAPIQNPQDIGFLYLEETDEKLYYSQGRFDNPVFLCDWDSTVATTAGDAVCKNWIPIITKDGDIVFLHQGKETALNPIVYPNTDYTTPVIVDFGADQKPSGLTTDTGACVSSYGDFFIFGEYRANGHTEWNGTPVRIWKVVKPYINKANWTIVDTWYYSNTGSPWGQNPTREITHFHTIAYDHYKGYWYSNTGDADSMCRVIKSVDGGETWIEEINGDQKYRTLGYVFTTDACYWGVDSSGEYHNLCKAPRDENGEIDFSATEILALLDDQISGQAQRTYNTCLLREPYGILLLDRAEPRTDGKLVLQFWSFDDEKLYTIATLKSSEGATTRYGFGNMACTYYQGNNIDGIICGSSTYERYISVDVLGSSATNRLGVLKIKVLRK